MGAPQQTEQWSFDAIAVHVLPCAPCALHNRAQQASIQAHVGLLQSVRQATVLGRHVYWHPATHTHTLWHNTKLHMFADLQDTIWMPSRPVVGRKAFNTFVQQMRQAYPDLYYEVGQVGAPVAYGVDPASPATGCTASR